MASCKNNINSKHPHNILNKFLIILFFLCVMLLGLYLPLVFHSSADDKSITVYMFTEYVSPDSIKDFEKSTGIKVYVQYFDSNEELYAKFKINRGDGYDLVTPSDYMVEMLRKDGLLQKIDLNKIPNFAQLDNRLLNLNFDPQNQFSIPLT